MLILSIETSCDETAISIVEASGGYEKPVFKVLAHTIFSQIDIHQEWGGVVPSIAKREHGKALVPLLTTALKKAGLYTEGTLALDPKFLDTLDREPELKIAVQQFLPKIGIPQIDAIAVTYGPGLEPALWVGINFAKYLSLAWQKPLIPVNHMEGHLFSSFAKSENNSDDSSVKVKFPAIALLVSGGHTELIHIADWLKYKVIGRTRDDAVGEAFDKVARLLGLPYPGGPEISKMALKYSELENPPVYELPRPMLRSDDFDFSFSGLKTAVLYLVKKIGDLTATDKISIAYEFQEAAIEVLLAKTLKALEKFGAENLIVGGGVSANKELKRRLIEKCQEYGIKLLAPEPVLSTDNATMIALAGYFRSLAETPIIDPEIKAQGNLSL